MIKEIVIIIVILSLQIESYYINSITRLHHHRHHRHHRHHHHNELSDEYINELVDKRKQHRLNKQYTDADSIKQYLNDNSIDVIDIPNEHGGSLWKRSMISNELLSLSIMELADKVNDIDNDNEVDDIIITVKEILRYHLNDNDSNNTIFNDKSYAYFKQSDKSNTLHGRKIADVAFKFATAGIKDIELFSLLLQYAEKELKRWGYRASCRSADVIYFIERLALSGYQYDERSSASASSSSSAAAASSASSSSSVSSSLFLTAIDILKKKSETYKEFASGGTYKDLTCQRLTLLSPRVLSSLFKHSSKQDKSGYQIDSITDSNIEMPSYNLNTLFDDVTRPLIVDLGCGYGTSLLGLCYNNDKDKDNAYNYLGCDMSRAAVLYASGIASRWGYDKKLRFLNVNVKQCLSIIADSYKGPVEVIMINFPTPYKYDIIYDYWNENGFIDTQGLVIEEGKNDIGNSELPQTFDHFMISNDTIKMMKDCKKNGSCYILVKSNVEDVAVYMQHLFLKSGAIIPQLKDLPSIFEKESSASATAATTATKNYDNTKRGLIYSATKFPKATGQGWLDFNPIPFARTETEVQYEFDMKKVYRFLCRLG